MTRPRPNENEAGLHETPGEAAECPDFFRFMAWNWHSELTLKGLQAVPPHLIKSGPMLGYVECDITDRMTRHSPTTELCPARHSLGISGRLSIGEGSRTANINTWLSRRFIRHSWNKRHTLK